MVSKTTQFDLASLSDEMHRAQAQLVDLQTHCYSELETALFVDALFDLCNRFANAFEKLEHSNAEVRKLEAEYINLLMDLTEYDTQLHTQMRPLF